MWDQVWMGFQSDLVVADTVRTAGGALHSPQIEFSNCLLYHCLTVFQIWSFVVNMYHTCRGSINLDQLVELLELIEAEKGVSAAFSVVTEH